MVEMSKPKHIEMRPKTLFFFLVASAQHVANRWKSLKKKARNFEGNYHLLGIHMRLYKSKNKLAIPHNLLYQTSKIPARLLDIIKQ